MRGGGPAWLVREPAQIQALNPVLVMQLIPINNLVVYPFLRRFGIEVGALGRMGSGLVFAGLVLLAALGFGLYTRRYPLQDHYRTA